MAKINNDATNTRLMQQHQLKHRSAKPSTEETDLGMCSSVLDLTRTMALNAASENATVADVLQANPDNKSLVSDVDQQLIFKVVFKEPVNITQISFRADVPPTDSESVSGPRALKCYANQEHFDFCDSDSVQPAQAMEISQKSLLEGTKMPLRGSRFQRCSNAQFFVEENQDDTEKTFVNRICLWGFPSGT